MRSSKSPPRGLWAALIEALVPRGLVAIFVLTIVWTGIVAAARTPERYAAELESFDPALALVTFQEGPLTGWYVYLYLGGERVVCANPKVWDGPKVITCSHVVSIDDQVPDPAEPGAPLAAIPAFNAFVPNYKSNGAELLEEVDLIQKRLTLAGQDESRRRR